MTSKSASLPSPDGPETVRSVGLSARPTDKGSAETNRPPNAVTYDHGRDRMPEEVRTADCHTFTTGEAYPDICLVPDCPAREYL